MKKSEKDTRKEQDPQYDTTVYDPHALVSLQKGLRQVYRDRGETKKEADTLFARLTVNLRILDYLYQRARDVLRGDLKAGVEFHRALERLTERRQDYAGSARALFDRTGIPVPTRGALAGSCRVDHMPGPLAQTRRLARPNRPARPGRPGLPCATVRYPGMAAIYMGLWEVYILRRNDLTQPPALDLPEALDTVVSLSLGHGHLEVLGGSLAEGGLEELGRTVDRETTLGNPYFQPGERPGAPDFPIPEPGGPGGFPEPEPGGGGGLPIPGNIYPPSPDECELIREACEGMLIEAVNEGLPPLPLPPSVSAWSDTIDSIELNGQCAGDTMVIHGHDFGSPKPPNVELIMTVNGACAVVPVDPGDWTDTQITVTLPDGVMPGPVGFYDTAQAEMERARYNNEVGRYNRAVRIIATASKCLGQPLDFPNFHPDTSDRIPCPLATDVNVITAGLPIIRSFTVSTDEATDVVVVAAPEDEVVLRWNVENSDTLALRHTWNVGGNSGSEQITNNATGSSWNLGAANHAGFGESTYRLTATNGCGDVESTVRVIRSQRPQLSIERIEVTQSIQTPDNDLPLVHHKPTVVRVYGTHGLNGFGGLDSVANVIGRMRIRRSGGQWSFWFNPVNNATLNPPDPPAPDPAASIDLPEEPNPARTNDTLNFVIPEALCEGTVDIEVALRVDDFGAPPNNPGFSERVSETFESVVAFQRRRRLNIKFIPVTVTPDPNGVIVTPGAGAALSNPPTNAQCRDFIQESLKFIPTTAESITRHPFLSVSVDVGSMTITLPDGTVIFSRSVPFDLSGNFWLEVIRLIRTCSFLDFVDLICPEDDDSYWALLVPATGPGLWGRANWIPSGEYLALMGRAGAFLSQGAEAHAAHELAHCLNQPHLNLCGASGGDEPNTDSWPDNGDVVNVPFDISRNSTVTGTGTVSDLMSYCLTRWTSERRWQRLFDFIGGE